MNRALSILLMVVMVLAPCAVTHAASMKSAPHMMSASDESHGQHADCHSGQQEAGHSVCSGDCDTLQRTTAAGTPERTVSEFNTFYPLLVFVLNLTLVAQVTESAPDIGSGNSGPLFDSKTVLRQTARFRL